MKKLALATAMSLVMIGCGGGGTTDVVVDDGNTDVVEYVPYPYAPEISEDQKQAYLDAVNDIRTAGVDCGEYGYMPAVDPLVWDDRLYRAAYEHSHDKAVNGYDDPHIGSGTTEDWTAQVLDLGRGSEISERAINNGIWDMGENAAWGYPTLDDVMDAWLESDAHCHNLMLSQYTMMGMAVVEESEEDRVFWTHNMSF